MTTIQTGLMITTTMRVITTISEINKIQQDYFTSILLDKVKTACYNNKAVARERELRKLGNSGNRETDREIDRERGNVVQEKFT